MRNWLIYEPPGGARRTLEDAEKFITVREGFSKVAFFFAPFWLIAKRCWIALALWAVAFVAVVAFVSLANVGGAPATLLLWLPNLAIGLENAWIRARSLERRGYTLAGAAMGRTREEAEAHFFVDWLAGHAEEPVRPQAASAYQRPASAAFGFFPQPGQAR